MAQQQTKKLASLAAKRRAGNITAYVILIIVSLIWILPFTFLVLQSFDCGTNTSISSNIIPEVWGFGNFKYLFSAETNFLKWYFNTFIIALFVCIGQTAMQFMMAYALSRFRFRLRKGLMNAMLVLGMFPGFLTMIVLYEVLSKFGFVGDNTVPGLIIVSIASSGMGYYVAKGFLDTLPKSLDEAAMVDGATRFQIFYKVIIPLCKPIVIYIILTSFMGPWGDFVFAYKLANHAQAGMNVATGLQDWLVGANLKLHFKHYCAAGVVVSIPVVTLFMFLQKYYVEGVTGGAVKG